MASILCLEKIPPITGARYSKKEDRSAEELTLEQDEGRWSAAGRGGDLGWDANGGRSRSWSFGCPETAMFTFPLTLSSSAPPASHSVTKTPRNLPLCFRSSILERLETLPRPSVERLQRVPLSRGLS